MKDDEMVAHYARADDGSPGVIRIGQLAERVVVALPRPCILGTTERALPHLNEDSKATPDEASTLAFETTCNSASVTADV
jgi:hypothetical protein